MSEAGGFKSANLLQKLKRGLGALRPIYRTTSSAKRRHYIKICLNQYEDLIQRTEAGKTCRKCEIKLTKSVVEHKLEKCPSNETLRIKYKNSEWLVAYKNLSESTEQKLKYLLTRMEINGFEIIDFLK